MFSFKTINQIKFNYKGCCLCSLKVFSAHVKISFANRIASVILAASKPLIIRSLCFLRWLYVWRGDVNRFQIIQFKVYFCITRCDYITLDNCLLTLSAYHNLFKIIFFAAWFTLIFKDWNLLVRLWRRLTNSKFFLVLGRFISSLPWPLKSENAVLVGSKAPSFWLTSK